MGRFAAMVLAVAVLAGCGGIREGDTLALSKETTIYFDEALFREEAELADAGAQRSVHGKRVEQSMTTHIPIQQGKRVKILKVVPGGAKVGLLLKDGVLETGFMLARELETAKKE